jgi:hypothetical protein
MFFHANLPSNVSLLYRMFVKIVMVKKSAKSQILNQRKMMCVTFVVTNMELEIVHEASSQTSRKKLRQEGGTLFGWGATPTLAVFQTTIPLVKPEVKTVQDSNGKEDSASYQESPKALCKAGKNVRQPSGKA